MKFSCFKAYKVFLVSDKGNKYFNVVARNIHHASFIATRVLLSWEDKDAYEISSISLIDSIFF